MFYAAKHNVQFSTKLNEESQFQDDDDEIDEQAFSQGVKKIVGSDPMLYESEHFLRKRGSRFKEVPG